MVQLLGLGDGEDPYQCRLQASFSFFSGSHKDAVLLQRICRKICSSGRSEKRTSKNVKFAANFLKTFKGPMTFVPQLHIQKFCLPLFVGSKFWAWKIDRNGLSTKRREASKLMIECIHAWRKTTSGGNSTKPLYDTATSFYMCDQ